MFVAIFSVSKGYWRWQIHLWACQAVRRLGSRQQETRCFMALRFGLQAVCRFFSGGFRGVFSGKWPGLCSQSPQKICSPCGRLCCFATITVISARSICCANLLWLHKSCVFRWLQFHGACLPCCGQARANTVFLPWPGKYYFILVAPPAGFEACFLGIRAVLAGARTEIFCNGWWWLAGYFRPSFGKRKRGSTARQGRQAAWQRSSWKPFASLHLLLGR